MAQISFRQGIVRTHPNALQFTNGNTAIKLEASPLPVVYTFADGPDTDYLYEEATVVDPAWTDLPNTSPYYLYYELDLLTGERTFGITTLQPIVSNSNLDPDNFSEGQMWFDTRASYERMNVKRNGDWRRVIRVCAATVNGTLISQEPEGSQVGFDNQPTRAGNLLFDDENKTKPVKRFDIRGRGKFITTETPVFSQFSNLTGFRLTQSIVDGQAVEPIAQYQPVALTSTTVGIGSPPVPESVGRQLRLARNTEPDFPCVGIALEETATGDVRSYVTNGYVTDDNFNIRLPEVDFSLEPSTPIYVNDNGQLTTDVPQSVSIQRVAQIVDDFTILVDVQPLIRYG